MNKRPFTKHPTIFLITPLLILVLFIFVLLPQASPTAADNAMPATDGVCVRFSLYQGRNAATGASVAGRYEMREVTTGGLLASWEADSQATVSDWITDLPQVADGGSWVEVIFYEGGEGTAVPLEILNPAPNTTFGWVANGQCHAVELQFPTNWSVNQSNNNNKNSDAIGGSSTSETVPEDTQEGNTANLSGFQQDWASNLGTLRPITDIQVTDLNTPLTIGKLGAWQDGDKLAYGFTLINTSADHYITDVEYLITFTGADGNLSEEHTANLRDLYPLEEVNLGESFFSSNQINYDQVEISIISAVSVAISDTPNPLTWKPGIDANFSETGIWIRQEQDEEGETAKDTNEAQFNFEVINPNATFIATNTTFSITIFDDAGNILGQGLGDIGDIQPLQSWELKGSIFVQSPELVDNVEIVIEPEVFTPVDPTTLPTRLIQEDQISFSGQNVNIVFPGQIDFEFHLTEMLTDSGFGFIVAIAYDSDGKAIGGGAHELFGNQLVSTAQSIFLPIRASALPATVELYITYDVIDNLPPRGGGGSHPGRDI